MKIHLKNMKLYTNGKSSFLAEVALSHGLLSSVSLIISHYLSLNAADRSSLRSLYQLLMDAMTTHLKELIWQKTQNFGSLSTSKEPFVR